MKNQIKIKKNYLIFRQEAKNLIESVRKAAKNKQRGIIFLDFANVDFMSRSFIDELLNGMNKLTADGLEIKMAGLKPHLRGFIFYVKKTKRIIRQALLK